jgi:hypothetical protein
VLATPILLMVWFAALRTRLTELAFGTRLPDAMENPANAKGQGVLLWIRACAILAGGVREAAIVVEPAAEGGKAGRGSRCFLQLPEPWRQPFAPAPAVGVAPAVGGAPLALGR